MLKFAGWVNSYDGRSGDLVVSARENREGWGNLELAAELDGGLIMLAEAGGLHAGLVTDPLRLSGSIRPWHSR